MNPTPSHKISVARLTEAFYRRKVAQIQARLDSEKLDGLLILDTHNVIYASGFGHTQTERPLGLLIRPGGAPTLYVPRLEVEHAAESWIKDVRAYFEYPDVEHPVLWMLRDSGLKRSGVDNISKIVWDEAATAGFDLRPTNLIAEMRWVKEPEEIALIEMASRYADFCLQVACDQGGHLIGAGGTEIDILNSCLWATADKMQQDLGETPELHTQALIGSVHSGPRAALPHGRPLKRTPQPGETLIVGIGAMVSGYYAESGVTFIIGEPNTDQVRCLKAADACSDAALAALRAGATCASVNEAALAALREAGFGDAIRHRIGHGLGLQNHESPWLAPGDSTVLQPNMVFSNEPGLYRPGLDGYRTINTMIVTDGAARLTTRFLTDHPLEKRILRV